MTSAEEFQGASTTQTDEFGGQATPSSVPGRSDNRLSASEILGGCLDPISVLPFELLEGILQPKLPSLDIMAGCWYSEECHPYMAALYTLRLVSTAWKDVVDGMPSLWTVISSTFPDDVNRTSLSRSGSSSLIIYFPRDYLETTTHFCAFLPIIEAHLHRCSLLALWLDLDFVDEVPWKSFQRLATLKIRIEGSVEGGIPPMKNIEIRDEVLENIRDINLAGQVPVDWTRTLGQLRGLRTLTLEEVFDNTITQEQFFSVILASPGIETLVISMVEIQDPPPNFSPSAEPISLPKLRSVEIATGALFANNLLRRIRPPSDMAKLEINPTEMPSHLATAFWEVALAPWVPEVQRLYQNSSERWITLHSPTWCILEALPEYSLSIQFTGLSTTAALRWIQDIVIAVDGEPRGLRMYADHRALEGNGVLPIIQTIQGLTEIRVVPTHGLSQPYVGALLNALGEPTADSIGTPDPRPTFPTLQKLEVRHWRWELNDIIDMVQRRYSMQSTGGQQVPELTLDISPLNHWYESGITRKINSFYSAKALRELDGVKKVRMAYLGVDWGILAVIWDEEESGPAWG